MDLSQLPANLPSPTTFKLLVVIPKFEDADPVAARAKALGIELSRNESSREEAASVVMQVVAMGPDAFKDASRYPSGAVCDVGDYVLTRAYSGTRFFAADHEFRIINDDAIDAVTSDPTGIQRISRN